MSGIAVLSATHAVPGRSPSRRRRSGPSDRRALHGGRRPVGLRGGRPGGAAATAAPAAVAAGAPGRPKAALLRVVSHRSRLVGPVRQAGHAPGQVRSAAPAVAREVAPHPIVQLPGEASSPRRQAVTKAPPRAGLRGRSWPRSDQQVQHRPSRPCSPAAAAHAVQLPRCRRTSGTHIVSCGRHAPAPASSAPRCTNGLPGWASMSSWIMAPSSSQLAGSQTRIRASRSGNSRCARYRSTFSSHCRCPSVCTRPRRSGRGSRTRPWRCRSRTTADAPG